MNKQIISGNFKNYFSHYVIPNLFFFIIIIILIFVKSLKFDFNIFIIMVFSLFIIGSVVTYINFKFFLFEYNNLYIDEKLNIYIEDILLNKKNIKNIMYDYRRIGYSRIGFIVINLNKKDLTLNNIKTFYFLDKLNKFYFFFLIKKEIEIMKILEIKTKLDKKLFIPYNEKYYENDDEDYLIDYIDSYGNTKLLNYVASGDLKKVKKMINLGVNINLPNNIGLTPLMSAIKNGYVGIVKILIINKADLTMKDNKNMTALDYAKEIKRKDILDLLNKKRGKNENIKNFNKIYYPSNIYYEKNIIINNNNTKKR